MIFSGMNFNGAHDLLIITKLEHVIICIICFDLLNLIRSLKSDRHLIRNSYFIQRNRYKP